MHESENTLAVRTPNSGVVKSSLFGQILIMQFADIVLRYLLPASLLHVIHCHTTHIMLYYITECAAPSTGLKTDF